MKHSIVIIFLIAFPLLLSFRINSELKTDIIQGETSDSSTTVNISFVGDLMCHSPQYNFAKVGADSFDFTGVFKEVKLFFENDDLTVGNLETVTAGESVGYTGYPFFNTPDEFIYALSEAGFDLLVTANNHALDQKEDGLLRTIEQISENGMMNSGTFSSNDERALINIIKLNRMSIAILSYTEQTNGFSIPNGKNYILNLIDYRLIKEDIIKARQSGAEIIITHFHYGPEYNRDPDVYQKSVVDSVIQLGADIIIGGHPHVIQPVDYFKTVGGKLDTGFVAYSVGNFISNQRWRYSDSGMILSIELTKKIDTDSIYISDVSYLPTWVFKGNTEKGREYIILPSQLSDDSTFTYLTREDRKLMNEAFNDTKEIVTKYNSGIKLIEK